MSVPHTGYVPVYLALCLSISLSVFSACLSSITHIRTLYISQTHTFSLSLSLSIYLSIYLSLNLLIYLTHPLTYSLLIGIDYNSSERQIKLAYRKLALRYHPDKNRDAGAEELFKNVTTAYTLLTDEVGDYVWCDIRI